METLKIKIGETVKLTVKISSDANVGSNVHLDDVVVKKVLPIILMLSLALSMISTENHYP